MAVSGTGQGETPQSLAAPAFAGFSPIAESGTKAALTTGMTTDRKIFDFLPRRGIMAEIEYPGVAQLVGRDIWDVEVGCSSHLTRTKIPLKSTISEGFSYSLSIAAQDLSGHIIQTSRYRLTTSIDTFWFVYCCRLRTELAMRFSLPSAVV